MNGAPTPARRNERELFLAALERPTPGDRAAFLDEACAGDPALRAAVEELLRHHREDNFLESPAVAAPAAPRLVEAELATTIHLLVGERPGDRIDRYKLLQTIGEGGVGVVFMAEQEAPVRRRVALKVLKPGMDTQSVIARFEVERQALALMDHPNIAKVLDAGSTPAGRPYFVMELVRGVRITEYCDQHRLSTRERLTLFVQVCHAIQHAHQKGIIHRDIKPSNLLVTLHDGVPVPKVIDFGIAKAIDQKLTDKTFFTEFHSFIGTPAYISPEQAEMSGLDVDTRTDIYSLGVLLYEMLTGRTPFDAQELVSSGLDGMRRTIREREPARPSTRLRTLPEAEQTTTAERRQTEPTKLASQLRGDLDWIVLKALEKDRTRRYATANDLAQDIQRYLDNEPVLARPPSATYRFRKLVRRNQLVFAGAGAFAAALLIGLGLSTWQFLEKSAAYQRAIHAEREQSRLRQEADAARAAAEVQALAARRRAYAADMNLAQQALAANNLGRAQELLSRHRPAEGFQVSNLSSQILPDLRGWEWRYLWQHCQSDALFTLCQLSNEVSALSVSHDGKWVAIGEHGEGGVSVWDLRARQQVVRFPLGESRDPLAFAPRAPVLAFYAPEKSERSGGWIRLWDVAARRLLGQVPVEGACGGVAFSADGARLLVASGDAEFTIWSVAEEAPAALETPVLTVSVSVPQRSGGRPPYGRRMVATPDLSLAAHALAGGRVQLVDLSAGQALWTAQAAEEEVTALALSPDGKTLATGAGFVESAIRLWDAATGREVARLEGHRTFVRALLFWPDGDTLVSASGDQTIHLWDVENLRVASVPSAASNPAEARPESAGENWGRVSSPSVNEAIRPRHPGGLGLSRLADQGAASQLQPELRGKAPFRFRPARRRVAEVRPYATLRGHRLEVWSLALGPDNATLVSGAKDGSVLVWDTATPRREQSPLMLPVPVRAWSFSPDGQAILVLDEEGRVARWQGLDFQQGQTLLELGTNIHAARFSADGRLLATASTDGRCQLWDLEQGAPVRELAPEGSWESPVAFLAGSSQLLVHRVKNRSFHLRDIPTGREIRAWPLPASGGPWKTALSADDQWWIALDDDGAGLLCHLMTGQQTPLTLPLKQISAVALSPDGQRLAVASVLGIGLLWDLGTKQKLAALHGYLQGTHSVAFSPDGQRLAIGSNGNEAIKLWDVQSHQELITLKGRGSMFNLVAFSPDGNVLAASNGQGLVHLWRAASFDEMARLEARER